MVEAHDLKGEDLLGFFNEYNKIKDSLNFHDNGNDNDKISSDSIAECSAIINTRISSNSDSDKDKLLQYEKDFHEQYLQPMLKKYPNLVLIGLYPSKDLNINLSHELLHASFFKDKILRSIIEQFWNEKVTKKDKQSIMKILSDDYDIRDFNLLINEFQAYILESDALNDKLAKYAKKYRELLTTILVQNNIHLFKD